MKGLLIKDFRLLSGQKRFFITVLVIGMFFIKVNENPASGIGYITILLSIFTLSTISYDEFDNGMAFLLTLPVTREMYVREKYVFAGLVSTISAVSASVFAGILSQVMDVTVHVEELVIGGIAVLFVAWVVLALAIPMQIKFGAERGRVAMILAIGLIFITILLFGKLMIKFGGDRMDVLYNPEEQAPWILAAGGIAAVLVGIVISYLICVRIMQKKEF